MNWKKEMIRDINYVSECLNLTEEEKTKIEEVSKIHPFCTTNYYLSLIDKSNLNDPLRMMQIPMELENSEDGDIDTSGESENTKLQGLQHKYDKTALVLSTTACAMYCRHCFRKRLVGLSSDEVMNNFEEALKYIEKNDSINNVLISGGDSFMLDASILEMFLEKLVRVEHLNFIRFGTRMPVVLPQRIYEDEYLLEILEKYNKKKQIYIITQFNHPREITTQSIEAINRLKRIGVVVNNQTVLLKGVNSDPLVLSDLMTKLVKIGVNPYYVFQCRPVKGVKNIFQLDFKEGIDIVRDAKKELSGLAKRFKFALSHKTGKIEILGRKDNIGIFKYHQSPNKDRMGEVFMKELTEGLAWFDDDFYEKL